MSEENQSAKGRSDENVGERTRIILRPMGSPLPLGFFTFGAGMALLASMELGVVGVSSARTLAWVLLCFVAPLEVLAGVLAFFARDGAAGTLLTIFGASWLANSVVMLMGSPGEPVPALGVFNVAMGAIVLGMAIVAWTAKPLFSILLLLAAARLGANAAYNFGGPHDLVKLAGAVGVVLWLVSMYGGIALSLEDARGKQAWPILRRGEAREAIEGHVGAQLEGLHHEAGVRRQL